MRKTTEVVTCDDCGQEIRTEVYDSRRDMDMTGSFGNVMVLGGRSADLCRPCLIARLRKRADELERLEVSGG